MTRFDAGTINPMSNSGSSLRAVVPTDLPIFFEQQLDSSANWMAAFVAEHPEDRAAFDAHWARILNDDSIITRSIIVADAVAGYISSFEHDGEREICYWLGASYWGRGIASAALAAFLLQQTARLIYARAVKDNLGSIKVLERCGFELIDEGRGYAHRRGAEVEEYIFRWPKTS